ncbi:MAG: glycine cleavage system protein GcvH [Rhizobiales bacterium]|nr:glycine cleavage system protein GcvH [Hyphomicrobiales bacterium]NRB13513.1 glycine cleavage system protein GcvH [Hyphomicrobiales bacterium]
MSKFYTEDHEYAFIDGDIATIGVSHHAQDQLGDVVFVELPEKGTTFEKGDEIAVVESVKAASEVYTAVAGEVIEVNSLLEDAPETVNAGAETVGWFIKIKMSNTADTEGLLDETAYQTHIAD